MWESQFFLVPRSHLFPSRNNLIIYRQYCCCCCCFYLLLLPLLLSWLLLLLAHFCPLHQPWCLLLISHCELNKIAIPSRLKIQSFHRNETIFHVNCLRIMPFTASTYVHLVKVMSPLNILHGHHRYHGHHSFHIFVRIRCLSFFR